MKLQIQVASTSQTVNVFIQDSSSTTGAGLAGLVFNTSSLTAYYALPKTAAVSITLATLAAVTSAWGSGGFKEVDATNMPGWYRFDIPDAALASGRFVSVHFKGAANMAPLPIEIELTAVNNQSATAFMTSVPTVAAVTAISTGGISSGSFAAGALDNAAIAANAIGASELATDAVAEIANGLLDLANVVGTGVTVRMALRGYAAALLAKASGQGTTAPKFRDLDDTKDAIVATADSSGNRSVVTLDLT